MAVRFTGDSTAESAPTAAEAAVAGRADQQSALDDPSFEALLRAAARVSDGESARRDPRLMLGATLASGRFQLLRRLGRGGMGVVFEVFDAERRAKVALKLLTGVRADRVYRLKNEFRTVLGLRHDNLVRLHELFADDGLWYYTMELVAGVPFDAYVRPSGALDLTRLRNAFAQLVSAVVALHRAGKLHRDLKPSNVLVTAQGKVVVLDFGLAVDAQRGGIGQTVTEHAICGTPAYMAPEQAAGRAPVAASDLYALGVMLHEALSGRLPFEGSAGEIIAAKQRDDAPAVSADVARDLSDLCRTLLARDPGSRPSADDLVRFCARSSCTTGAADAQAADAQAADAQAADAQAADAQAADAEDEGAIELRLVGRDDELAYLERCHFDSARGQAVVVDVQGESGVGKSALCAAFVERLPLGGDVTVLSARCYERESVPYKAFDPLVDALTRRLRKLAPGDVEALVPEHAAELTRVFPVLERVPAFRDRLARTRVGESVEEERRRAFSAFAAILTNLRARGPLVVIMDDLQWADADSLVLLRQLLQTLSAPLLFVLSQRSDASGSALSRVLNLARENRAVALRRLPLLPLSEPATALLVSTLAPDLAARPRALAAVVRAAEGNPFLAARLARVSPRDGSIAEDVSAALRSHGASLEGGAERLLSLLAMAGEPVLARVALEAAGATHEELERLLHERLVSVRASPHAHGSGKTIECYHDRIRESVFAALGPRERAHYARRFAEVLGTLDAASSELQRRCLMHAGEHAQARKLTVRAAELAATSLAFERAAELYGEALASGELAEAERLELMERRAAALVSAGQGGEAGRLYRALSAATSGERSLSFLRSAATQLLTAGHYNEGQPLLERLCEQTGVHVPSGRLRSRVHLAWSQARLELRGLSFEKRESSSGKLRLEAAHALSISALNYGSSQIAAVCAYYLRLALELGDGPHAVVALGLNAIALSRKPSGAVRASVLLTRLYELVQAEDDLTLHAVADFASGAVAFHAQQVERARELLTMALAVHLRATGRPYGPIDVCRMYLQMCEHALGDFAALARNTPPAIDDAFRRGRLYLGVMLTGPSSVHAWLLRDDAEGLGHRIEDARKRWPRAAEPQLPDFTLLGSEVLRALYTGEPERGLDLLCMQAPSFTRSLGPLYARMAAPAIALLKGFCAAAALRNGACERPVRELVWIIEQTVLSLRPIPRCANAVRKFTAVLALARGDVEAAIGQLREKASEHQPRERGLFDAARLLRLGQLLGGDAGAEYVREGTALMRAQGAVDVEALTEVIFPGLRSP